MSARHASDLTVVELKEKLKELGFSCYGNKNELMLRLREDTTVKFSKNRFFGNPFKKSFEPSKI